MAMLRLCHYWRDPQIARQGAANQRSLTREALHDLGGNAGFLQAFAWSTSNSVSGVDKSIDAIID